MQRRFDSNIRSLPMRKIYAKTDETLIEHTSCCLNVWNQLKNIYYPFIPDQDFWNKSFLMVMFHDIGKIVDSFQEMIRASIEGRFYNYDLNFRHELLSGVLVAKFLDKDLLPIAAVFSHHRKLNDELFESDKGRNVQYSRQDIIDFVDYFQDQLSKSGSSINADQFRNFPEFNCKQFYDRFWKLICERMDSLNANDRNRYIFYKGILNICDWLGSGHNEPIDSLEIQKEILRDKISLKVGVSIQFDDFQNQCANTSGDCLIIAPTGSGKTEAALLWAGTKPGKIVYLLPTRVTSNAIFGRMKTYFGESNVGLVHSSAFDYLSEKNEDYDFKDYNLERTFFKPLTVATIDQLLTTGFNVGRWAMKELNCIGAKVIVDEIHAYDFYTLGLTIATIRHFRRFGTSFFLMSATIPRFLMELIEKEIPGIVVIRNDSLMEKSRNRFIIEDHGIDECETDIVAKVRDGKKVLVVVNTVNEAIRLYEHYTEEYKDISPLCYHSRFIVREKNAKEKKIIDASEAEKGCLVITTQVVEVSLDIDFDMLFTENAPADAIIQRAGRINRKRGKTDSVVTIVCHKEVSEKVYNPTLLRKSYDEFSKYHNRYVTEEDFLTIVDHVYDGVNLETDKNFIEGLEQYNKVQEHYNYIQDVYPNDGDIFTRIRDYLKISVIPEKYLEEVNGKKPSEKAKYLVDVPYWVKRRTYQYEGFLVCPLDYKVERGAKLEYDTGWKRTLDDGGSYVF
ncbi:MAG: CRISPR-associated helicase Cas3' [bacterium]